MVEPEQFCQPSFKTIASFRLQLTNHNSCRFLGRFGDKSVSNDRAFYSFAGTKDLDQSLGCPLDFGKESVGFRLAIVSFGKNALISISLGNRAQAVFHERL